MTKIKFVLTGSVVALLQPECVAVVVVWLLADAFAVEDVLRVADARRAAGVAVAVVAAQRTRRIQGKDGAGEEHDYYTKGAHFGVGKLCLG